MMQELTVRFLGDLTAPQISTGKLHDVMAVKFLKKDLARVKEYLIKKAGIYFLMTEAVFCPNTTSIYIGESRDIFKRIEEHISEDWWMSCIVIVDRNAELRKEDVKYLESELLRESLGNGFKLKNKKCPDIKGTPILDRFLEAMEYHIYTLGGPCLTKTTEEDELCCAEKNGALEIGSGTFEIGEVEDLSKLTGMEIFTNRIGKKLQSANIESLTDLTAMTYSEFLTIPGIGRKTAVYVKTELIKNGMDFREERVQIETDFLLEPEQQKLISTWLSTTDAVRVCAVMIHQEVLHLYGRKPPKKISNEICALIRQHEKWMQYPTKTGKMRFAKYGLQMGFVRKLSIEQASISN